MKKKLIAIVASLAMVATMVPATAFAGTAGTKVVDVKNITADLTPEVSLNADYKAAYAALGTAQGVTIGAQSDVTAKFANGTLTVEGTLPCVDMSAMGYAPDLAKGNFIGTRLRVQNPIDGETGGWAMVIASLESNGTTQYTNYKLFQEAFTENKDGIFDTIGRVDGSVKTYNVYYLTNAGIAKFNEVTEDGTKNRFGDSPLLAGPNKGGTKADLDALINGKDTDADKTPYVIDYRRISIDTSNVELLNENQTTTYVTNKKNVKGFVDAVTAIKTSIGAAKIDETNQVTDDYRTKTVEARAKYTGLTTAQKALIDNAAKGTAEKDAYEGLLVAEKNVASYDTLDNVAALIAALPSADKLDVTNEAQVKQVKDAEAAVNALTEGVQKVLLKKTTNKYLTSNQIEKYEGCLKKVNNAAAQAVIDAIKALPELPKEFADKAGVDTVNAPLVATEKAFKALSEGEQKAVTNAAVLAGYRDDYNKLMKAYVDPMWAEAEKIKLSADTPLTESEIALITELKAYVEGRYLDTASIKDFDQDVYDALVEALGNQDKAGTSLENATIAAIADQAYTGSAIEPAVSVTDQAGKEIAAEEYTVIYSNNKDAGTATVTVAAKSSSAYTGSVSATFTITPAALTADMVKVANATYTGKAVRPTVSVASGVDYTVAYRNNTAVGKASAVVTGTGNYTGTITKNFIVKPAKESITSLKAGKKQITVAYKAQTGAKYRVICKASGLKAVGTNTTATKKTVKKLKSGKTYQVKVRAYKAVDGTPYYGAYSAVKKVKVK